MTTNKKSLDEIRDELAEKSSMDFHEYVNPYFCIAFKKGFDAATKIHQEKYDALMVEAKKLQAALSDTMYSYHGQECEYEPFIDGKETLKEFDKFLQELEK